MKYLFSLTAIGCLMTVSSFGQLKSSTSVHIDVACTTPTVNKMEAIDTAKGRQVANNYLTWENGEVILVKFMNNAGSQSIRNKIMAYAK